MVGLGGSSAGSYLADPTSPIPSHCASIVVTGTLRVKCECKCTLYSSGIRASSVDCPVYTPSIGTQFIHSLMFLGRMQLCCVLRQWTYAQHRFVRSTRYSSLPGGQGTGVVACDVHRTLLYVTESENQTPDLLVLRAALFTWPYVPTLTLVIGGQLRKEVSKYLESVQML